ncbi:transglutaminase domain-containing protein [Aureitalea marina]|uniref:Transglutaminase-like domain-containing protein n=1 Tax=Aureitalea marina TaxID=930804 RepID=A0A2S7KLZ7_9FLAO|nr:transglutaminase domain-containing protein [Aureitalea marina]PQB03659.1 hypothetical protein BST85_01140 [Aureitalea marina]
MKKLKVLIVVLIVCTSPFLAQNKEYGKVSLLEVASKQDAEFPEADAVVLSRRVVAYIGNYVEVQERIKIYNKDAFDYATVHVPYPDATKLKASTYNLVNNEIVATNLDDDLVFTDEVVKGVDLKKFTFPDVKAGSVLEYTYRSPNGTTSNINLQYGIPIKDLEVKVTNKMQIGFEVIQNPRAFLLMNRKEEGKSTYFTAQNVQPLKSESYVYDMDLYRSFLKINLTAVGTYMDVSDWRSLAGSIASDRGFTRHITARQLSKEEISAILDGETDPVKKAEKIYWYVKNNTAWNDSYDVFPEQSGKQLLKGEEGTMADINALLISALRDADLEAQPVLLSTRLNGIPLSPSVEAFNAMVAGVQIGEQVRLYDAAVSRSTVNYLDLGLVNWKGMYVDLDDRVFKWVEIPLPSRTARTVMGQIEIQDDGLLTGQVQERNSGYLSVGLRDEWENDGVADQVDRLSFNANDAEIFDITAKSDNPEITDQRFSFEWEEGVEEVGGKLYVDPLLFYTLNSNPFTAETRQFPIDFGFAQKQQITMTMKIPEGYQVESVPEPLQAVLPEKMGSYVFQVTPKGQQVVVRAIFKIDQPLVSFDRYELIKEFFRVRVAKETEKIVLSKP